MPLISESSYQAPVFFGNPHAQTVFPTLFRTVSGVTYQRERIPTPDDDFLDLDWRRNGSARLAIVLHGLEGNSTRAYVKGMVKALTNNGWDVVAMNFRGCGGEINRRLRFYHSGETEDLRTVISRAAGQGSYSETALIGFSLGGSIVLNYLGRFASRIHSSIKKAVTFSVPCDLTSSALKMSSRSNRLYIRRFVRMLQEKVRAKARIMPDAINLDDLDKVKTFEDFDNLYTAPIHGFRDARDYWEKASSKPFLANISIPTLLVNAADDPFLDVPCFPVNEARASNFFFLEIPARGGHVGFVAFNNRGMYWSESRALRFLNEPGEN